jgi:phosphatidylglycerophosphatase A
MSRAWQERPISTFVATGCGIGMIPFAPGTWGSVEGLLMAHALAIWTGHGFLLSIFAACLLGGFGAIVSSRCEAVVGVKDPGAIVIDEVAGQLLAAAPVVLVRPSARPWLAAASFLLFRLFDIWKPGPIRKLQDLPGGWGIMLDDIAAGILAGGITYAIGRWV